MSTVSYPKFLIVSPEISLLLLSLLRSLYIARNTAVGMISRGAVDG